MNVAAVLDPPLSTMQSEVSFEMTTLKILNRPKHLYIYTYIPFDLSLSDKNIF